MTDSYSDIIHLPHHRSNTRRHMSDTMRAAQFAPFAALTGFDGRIGETARLTDRRLELSEEEEALLNERIHLLMEHIRSTPAVTAVYFVPDERKSGGAYVTISGELRRIDEVQRELVFADGQILSLDDVYRIESPLFSLPDAEQPEE